MMRVSTSIQHLLLPTFIVLTLHALIHSFTPSLNYLTRSLHQSSSSPKHHRFNTAIFGGTGIAKTYSWKEEQFEIELKVYVPKSTKAKDISFKILPKSVHLSLGDEVILDGSRQFRGMVDVDGTFWSFSDDNESTREVTITMEKFINPPADSFEVVDYDWGGIYAEEEEDLVSKNYDEAETLDIRDYAASLGVDIDNINMTKVDKSMFSSGLNMTRDTLDELSKAGLVNEVTQQNDGSESINDGVPFQPLGKGIGRDEMDAAGINNGPEMPKAPIPFLDTDSPWSKSMPVEEARGEDNEDIATISDDLSNAEKKEMENKQKEKLMRRKNVDPIDLLTVARLKEILRADHLKVSGNKKELQDRLKAHIATRIRGSKKNGKQNDWQ